MSSLPVFSLAGRSALVTGAGRTGRIGVDPIIMLTGPIPASVASI